MGVQIAPTHPPALDPRGSPDGHFPAPRPGLGNCFGHSRAGDPRKASGLSPSTPTLQLPACAVLIAGAPETVSRNCPPKAPRRGSGVPRRIPGGAAAAATRRPPAAPPRPRAAPGEPRAPTPPPGHPAQERDPGGEGDWAAARCRVLGREARRPLSFSAPAPLSPSSSLAPPAAAEFGTLASPPPPPGDPLLSPPLPRPLLPPPPPSRSGWLRGGVTESPGGGRLRARGRRRRAGPGKLGSRLLNSQLACGFCISLKGTHHTGDFKSFKGKTFPEWWHFSEVDH
ncbi:uncharacterized protein LOC113593201 [Acinonyx jubatus]|uniref:Uncharacterized protein LOC113593201 n=1 Tax=Acinonyx jubatus TaxID=32536 RepID=A0ABM3Q197_ACIJB|nr:uncharacterized protein LOC113593201 [Acinonyx jubatus]